MKVPAWLPLLLSGILAIAGAAAEPIRHYIATHEIVYVLATFVGTLVASVLPPVLAPKKAEPPSVGNPGVKL